MTLPDPDLHDADRVRLFLQLAVHSHLNVEVDDPNDYWYRLGNRNAYAAAAALLVSPLDPDAALRSVTLSPAEILGVADQLGSIDPGKSATLIVTDGSPLELTTRIEMAFVHGKKIDLSNKQTELDKKYREKYRQQKSAPKP